MTTLADKVRLLGESGLFDEAWYVERYPDVLRCGMSAIEHYVRVGQHIGRKPNSEQDGAAASRFLAACRVVEPSRVRIDEALRQTIEASRLFDAGWYRARFASDLPQDADALADYLSRSAADPAIDPGPLFSTSYYAQANPDLRHGPLLAHACRNGIVEGRPVFDAHKVDTFLDEARTTDTTPLEDLLDASRPVTIMYWKDGNFFFSEIAEYLRVYLEKKGFKAFCEADLAHSVARGNIVVVAPHEFCVHGPGKDWSEAQLAEVIYLNTEQWHTSWFSLAYRFLTLSNKAIDMNPASASGLQSMGIRTAFLPLLPMEGTPFHVANAPISDEFGKARYIRDLTYPDTLAERPYDVLFVGAANPRREAALASLAPVLADHEPFLHCPSFNGPVRQGDPDMMATSDLVQIARNSKILLNIHQGESRYFEWHRLFLFGIMEGCVVLTEPCIPNAYVEAGRDFLECPLEDMPKRLRWLLETAEGHEQMSRIRANCDRLRENATDWKKIAA